jgi:hypothetical protein
VQKKIKSRTPPILRKTFCLQVFLNKIYFSIRICLICKKKTFGDLPHSRSMLNTTLDTSDFVASFSSWCRPGVWSLRNTPPTFSPFAVTILQPCFNKMQNENIFISTKCTSFTCEVERRIGITVKSKRAMLDQLK